MKTRAQTALAALMLVLTACGLPVNQMTAKERKADMNWAFTIFEHNYAPAELKKSNYGVELSQLQLDCETMAEQDMSNQDFLALFQKCIHSLKDAHVGAQQMNNGLLPEYAQVAHLGFVTMRTKAAFQGEKTDALRIIAPLKGSDTPGAPLIPGDLIVQVDDQAVSDYLQDSIVPFIDVGQDETSLTVAGFRFGVRTSIDMALPSEDEIKLRVVRGAMEFDIKLPWIREDLLSFNLKQNPPEENPEGESDENKGDSVSEAALVARFNKNGFAQTFFGYTELKHIVDGLVNPVEAVTNRLALIAKTGYQLAKFNPVMNALFNGQLDRDGELDLAIRSRILPFSSEVQDLMAEPMFTAKAVTTDNGQTYAYIQITSFPAEDKILTEWFRAITAIEDKGIKSVVIDLIDNGGGSLIHGMRMVNMLRKKTLALPSMQVRLNNNWVNSFRTQAAFGEDDYGKAIAARVVKDLEADMAAGRTLSRPISVSVMDPFFLQNPGYGLSDDVKVAVMVNEICVSMCDIFTSVIQDNNLALVVGQRTMGGGGNVVQHGLSPVAKIGMALTESLIISPSGKYIEDEGVKPDILVDMVEDRETGFQKAFNKALEYVLVPVTDDVAQ